MKGTESKPTSLRVAYQGQPGAYSEQAALVLCGRATALLPCDTLADVFAAVRAGRASCAVVPIENTLAGAVPGVLDLILRSGVTVSGETTERISHVLAAPPGVRLAGVREVLSHPVALAQCQRFFHRHPSVRAVPVFDTAGALAQVMRSRPGTRAAIASARAARLYGARVLGRRLQDHPQNFTRFVRVEPEGSPPPFRGACRLVLAVRLRHRAGALARALGILADSAVNLTRIDSQPVAGRPFEYEFVLEGLARSVAAGDAAVAALRRAAVDVRVVGVFAAGPRRSALRRV